MRRGTTDHIELDISNFDLQTCAEIWVDIAQGNKVRIHKTMTDMIIDDDTAFIE